MQQRKKEKEMNDEYQWYLPNDSKIPIKWMKRKKFTRSDLVKTIAHKIVKDSCRNWRYGHFTDNKQEKWI